MKIETERLVLRKMTQDDYFDLCKILRDKDVMYAYEHAFSAGEAQFWLDKQLENYIKYGFGLFAVTIKETGEMIGQCGITMQDVKGSDVHEIGYLFQKAYWNKGYATESAIACKAYAFNVLGIGEVYSIIRDSNVTSQNVAKRNGMELVDGVIKHYYGMEMPHLVYKICK